MPMSAIQLRRRVRRADKPVAVIVGVGNMLLCGVLFMMMIGGLPGFEATTREQETSARILAGQIFGGWLAGGLLLLFMLGMTRASFSHLATMLFTPIALILILMLL
ncbi:hypothetical protein E5Z02_03595 [Streptomyces rhizosphaericola]|uniref:Uncharacterized protein n=3 Tax=Streptomyces TaxID=1883 RepID=A0ABY2PMP3_9ACTN|nr:hypothetical protein E5Z02_03595 [Streptomyces rhizosphaericola]